MLRPSDQPPADERTRQILDERARRLAEPPPDEQGVGDTVNVLLLNLAHECYAIETAYVREVLRAAEIVPVPRAPNLLYGICALRGELLPVFDLRSFLNLPSRSASTTQKVVVVGTSRAEFGILADDVLDIMALSVQALSEGAERETPFNRSYLLGITKDALIVLDGRNLLEEQAFFLE